MTRAIGFGIVCGLVGAGWMIYQQRSWRQFHDSLAAYETGRASVESGETEAAERAFQQAIARCDWYGHPHYRLGILYDQTEKTDRALASLAEAFERYPIDNQGFWDPERNVVEEAYEFRAELYTRLGKAELAEQDGQLVNKVDTSYNFFGGIFRYWEWWQEPDLSPIDFGDSVPPAPPAETSP